MSALDEKLDSHKVRDSTADPIRMAKRTKSCSEKEGGKELRSRLFQSDLSWLRKFHLLQVLETEDRSLGSRNTKTWETRTSSETKEKIHKHLRFQKPCLLWQQGLGSPTDLTALFVGRAMTLVKSKVLDFGDWVS